MSSSTGKYNRYPVPPFLHLTRRVCFVLLLPLILLWSTMFCAQIVIAYHIDNTSHICTTMREYRHQHHFDRDFRKCFHTTFCVCHTAGSRTVAIQYGKHCYRSFIYSSPPLVSRDNRTIGILWWQATLSVALSPPFSVLNWLEWEKVCTHGVICSYSMSACLSLSIHMSAIRFCVVFFQEDAVSRVD